MARVEHRKYEELHVPFFDTAKTKPSASNAFTFTVSQNANWLYSFQHISILKLG